MPLPTINARSQFPHLKATPFGAAAPIPGPGFSSSSAGSLTKWATAFSGLPLLHSMTSQTLDVPQTLSFAILLPTRWQRRRGRSFLYTTTSTILLPAAVGARCGGSCRSLMVDIDVLFGIPTFFLLGRMTFVDDCARMRRTGGADFLFSSLSRFPSSVVLRRELELMLHQVPRGGHNDSYDDNQQRTFPHLLFAFRHNTFWVELYILFIYLFIHLFFFFFYFQLILSFYIYFLLFMRSLPFISFSRVCLFYIIIIIFFRLY